ncbi:uncharacterized protein LOC113003350 [Solenopsis invicta]|uniref:uncharacterized protein LOC113003350 n=1 Tax=Solenopsis invicta TaxID=13686 RepID=UPI00193D691F|nr:uncharacterized protein LOC113003350 [Solenopsis invicta]
MRLSAAWIGNEPRHKTRGIRGFILFHSILHGRQPPREYGIKLLRRLTKDDEIEAAAAAAALAASEKADAVVDIETNNFHALPTERSRLSINGKCVQSTQNL